MLQGWLHNFTCRRCSVRTSVVESRSHALPCAVVSCSWNPRPQTDTVAGAAWCCWAVLFVSPKPFHVGDHPREVQSAFLFGHDIIRKQNSLTNDCLSVMAVVGPQTLWFAKMSCCAYRDVRRRTGRSGGDLWLDLSRSLASSFCLPKRTGDGTIVTGPYWLRNFRSSLTPP